MSAHFLNLLNNVEDAMSGSDLWLRDVEEFIPSGAPVDPYYIELEFVRISTREMFLRLSDMTYDSTYST